MRGRLTGHCYVEPEHPSDVEYVLARDFEDVVVMYLEEKERGNEPIPKPILVAMLALFLLGLMVVCLGSFGII